ncbi:hypothetical protein BXZ70DRAFT_918325 [Cristinia sonorae]|uniref:Uncharacterized protein n=1 Tax=Cristinia sonorae TaxID=1940300 RepID=A0A8K0UYI6_9AGAR|nr:hypothetical protein BXZ70DRAFT_918325 [Cristinia sonorae]
MASPAMPAASSGGTSSSMWAGQTTPVSPAPSRGGWGQQGSFRGSSRGRGGGRGAPRDNGRGGRAASNPRGGPPSRSDAAPSKPNADQPNEKPVKAPATPAVKAAATPSSKPASTSTSAQSSSTKTPAKPKPIARKPSEQKTPRSKAPSVSESPAIPAMHSPALSTASTTASRSGGRRKRSNAKAPSAPSRKASVSSEPISRSKLDRPSVIVTKDIPPHLATVPDTPSSFDIKHSVDALVERVRAVAMDRPNTPGSHIDWAGDEDDSLPDLDDWGVTSSTAGTAEATGSDVGASRIISPILEDTLKPLPSLDDYPASTLANTDDHSSKDSPKAEEIREGTSSKADDTSEKQSTLPKPAAAANRIASSPPKANPKGLLHPSLPAKPNTPSEAGSKRSGRRQEPPKFKATDVSNDTATPTLLSRLNMDDDNSSSKDSSPERGLAASMHAIPTSHSAPSDVSTHFVPHRTSQFNPTHNRAHTVGARIAGHRQPFSPPGPSFSNHVASDGERPRRGDHTQHARTQSTPPTGPGTAGNASRRTRPVITVDAISKLARTLGGQAAPPKRETPPAAATVANGAKE